MTANVITYRGRSAAREVGKGARHRRGADRSARKSHGHFEFRDQHDTLPKHLSTVGLDSIRIASARSRSCGTRCRICRAISGSTPAGMVICQGQLDAVVPLENASMPGRVVVQWDKDDCADMGIVKVDLLGLGMMAAIQDALTIVNTGQDGQSPSCLPCAPGRGLAVTAAVDSMTRAPGGAGRPNHRVNDQTQQEKH